MNTRIYLLAFGAALSALSANAEDEVARGYALAGEKGCFECHTMSYAYIGPSFRALAERYRLDPDTRAQLPGIIRAGSRGHWGERFAMRPRTHLTDEQVNALIDWILSQ
ncbi:MAG TPA: c-type cytochrome [Burkholderiales bacterium]|nr:c-type cytochrome [Burkholderiales bacterium]